MDEMWMEQNMNMEMVRYKVLETGYKVGYIEFVDNSEVITSVHKWRGFFKGPFNEKSIYEYFKQEVYPIHFKLEFNKLKEQRRKLIREKVKKQNSNVAQSIIELPSAPAIELQPGEVPKDPDADL